MRPDPAVPGSGNKKRYDKIMGELEKVSSYEDIRDTIELMSCDERDPFHSRSYSIIERFPLSFFEFSAKTQHEDMTNLFNPQTWFHNRGADGYKTLSYEMYSNPTVKEAFLDYLLENLKSDNTIKEVKAEKERVKRRF
jgi:hypothetical protein